MFFFLPLVNGNNSEYLNELRLQKQSLGTKLLFHQQENAKITTQIQNRDLYFWSTYSKTRIVRTCVHIYALSVYTATITFNNAIIVVEVAVAFRGCCSFQSLHLVVYKVYFCVFTHMYIYIYIYICAMHTYLRIYAYIYIYVLCIRINIRAERIKLFFEK